MIYLDTNVLVWVTSGYYDKISQVAYELMNSQQKLLISPMVMLELQYLYEIKRLTKSADKILEYAENFLGLEICEKSFFLAVKKASHFHWTRDPFDRLITAQAALDEDILLTKDKHIRKHYSQAVW